MFYYSFSRSILDIFSIFPLLIDLVSIYISKYSLSFFLTILKITIFPQSFINFSISILISPISWIGFLRMIFGLKYPIFNDIINILLLVCSYDIFDEIFKPSLERLYFLFKDLFTFFNLSLDFIKWKIRILNLNQKILHTDMCAFRMFNKSLSVREYFNI